MKLIHLPTGETYDEKAQPYFLLNKYPYNYIRAELPEHWRVEGYDKSWEWASTEWVLNPEGLHTMWEVVAYNKVGMGSLALNAPKLDEISRAEFEYHIYNPWKAQKEIDSHLSNDNEQLDMSDLDTLKQQAEKMGYELVRKVSEWYYDEINYRMDSDGVSAQDGTNTLRLSVDKDGLELLIKKYNQFHGTPTT